MSLMFRPGLNPVAPRHEAGYQNFNHYLKSSFWSIRTLLDLKINLLSINLLHKINQMLIAVAFLSHQDSFKKLKSVFGKENIYFR